MSYYRGQILPENAGESVESYLGIFSYSFTKQISPVNPQYRPKKKKSMRKGSTIIAEINAQQDGQYYTEQN